MELIHIISLIEAIIIALTIITTRITKKDKEYIKQINTQINNSYIQTLKNTIYSNQPLLERLIAFKEYIKNGGNGNCKNFVICNLILPNKELWQSIVDNDYLDNRIINKEAYIKTLDEIKKQVLT